MKGTFCTDETCGAAVKMLLLLLPSLETPKVVMAELEQKK